MTSDSTAPEPIEAEYESTGEAEPRFGRAPPRKRSAVVTHRDVIIASSIAGSVGAILGAVIAIVAGGANSGAATGTLAQEIDAIRSAQTQLVASAEQVSGDIVALRSRLDTQADRISQREAGELDVRNELGAVNAQLSALIGAGDGKAPAPASAATSPLGVLLSRLNRLETIVATDADGPKTTRQLQRSLIELTEQVTALSETQRQYSAMVGKRQMSFDALENGLEKLTADVAALQAEVAQASGRRPQRTADARSVSAPIIASAAESRTIRALSALETAARNGQGFAPQQQTLAALLPADKDVASLQPLAQKGAPTLEQLRREFSQAARAAERISSAPQDDGWNWLRSTLAAPRADEGGHGAAALIVEARQSLENGDLRAAIEAVEDMDIAPAAAFKSWRDNALLRARLDEALDALNAKLTAQQTSSASSG